VNSELQGRRAVVGGATSGIGRAIADRLAERGCSLLLWARRHDELRMVADDLASRHGVDVSVANADAQDPACGQLVAEAAQASLGGADVLVLNAGGPPPTDPRTTDPAGWTGAFQLLAITPIDLATRLLPGMGERGWGRVVAILSSGVRQPIPELAYSNGGRSALAAWLKTVSRSVASNGVTVNGVLPGRIRTDRAAQLEEARAAREQRSVEEIRTARLAEIPAGRYGEANEVGELVAFLASERAAYITGALIPIDGGMATSQ
jgi:3-oxoacyl-[acyl-carrier protein] reductase